MNQLIHSGEHGGHFEYIRQYKNFIVIIMRIIFNDTGQTLLCLQLTEIGTETSMSESYK